jgi:hypothetical protein
MRELFLVALVTLAGCSHQISLMPRDGGQAGAGEANESGKKVTINLNGRTYMGTYVHDGGKVITRQLYRPAQAYSGVVYATAFGSSTATTYVPGSGNGKILATSDGDALHCDFQYSDSTGIGICTDNAGKQYDLLISN